MQSERVVVYLAACDSEGELMQDLSMHKEEIHSKLVAIMRERLATNLKQLPLIATTWSPNSPPNAQQVPPSNFAQTNAKQLRILSQVGGLAACWLLFCIC